MIKKILFLIIFVGILCLYFNFGLKFALNFAFAILSFSIIVFVVFHTQKRKIQALMQNASKEELEALAEAYKSKQERKEEEEEEFWDSSDSMDFQDFKESQESQGLDLQANAHKNEDSKDSKESQLQDFHLINTFENSKDSKESQKSFSIKEKIKYILSKAFIKRDSKQDLQGIKQESYFKNALKNKELQGQNFFIKNLKHNIFKAFTKDSKQDFQNINIKQEESQNLNVLDGEDSKDSKDLRGEDFYFKNEFENSKDSKKSQESQGNFTNLNSKPKKARFWQNFSAQNAKTGTKMFFYPLRLFAYGFLVVGILALIQRDLFDTFAFFSGLICANIFVVLWLLSP